MEKLAGAASSAVRDLLAGPPVQGRVVAVFPRCAYVDLGGQLLAVETTDGLRLPCAVSLALPAASRPLSAVAAGAPARAGRRSVSLGPLEISVARWWAPARPRGAVPPGTPEESSTAWDAAVLGLLGRGPGLTPAGDDLLAGLLLGLAGRPALRDHLAGAVARHAPARTTWLSAELLRHAAAGRGIPAAVAVADALAGHGPADAMTRALPALLAVGHTSGAALAHGLLMAAETLAGRQQLLDRTEAAA